MKINIKLTHPLAKVPCRSNPTDAGADCVSPIEIEIGGFESGFIDLGFQMEIPEGYCGMLFARSGLGSKFGIRPRNCVGIIDSKYRGNVGVMLENNSPFTYKVNKGDRIVQMVIVPISLCSYDEVDELDMTDDRDGGFGSTGIKSK